VGKWVARGRGKCIKEWIARGRDKCIGEWVARGGVSAIESGSVGRERDECIG